MFRVVLTLLAAAALLAAAQATAGGFATVRLDSLPAGTEAGGTWSPTLTVLQHGITPLDDISPVVRITNGGDTLSFPTEPTGEPGQYRADVEFPAAGSWRYEIDDGFSQTHSYTPVIIGAAVADGAGSSSWWAPLLGVLVAAVALALVGLGLRRRHARHVALPGV